MINYKGKALLNSILVTRYYKQISGKKFFEEFKNYDKMIKSKKGKLSIDDFDDYTELFMDVYLAGRCAFEKRLLTVEEQDNELSEISICDLEFYRTVGEFMKAIVETAQKQTTNNAKKK